jgi:hypothetical protein
MAFEFIGHRIERVGQFSDFVFRPHYPTATRDLALQSVRVVFISSGNEDLFLTHNITFDSLYLIPEPTSLMLFSRLVHKDGGHDARMTMIVDDSSGTPLITWFHN